MKYNQYIEYFNNTLNKINQNEIDNLIKLILDKYKTNRMIFIIGNGGSAANASHFAQDLAKGTIKNKKESKRIRALSLTDNMAYITALGNDEGYNSIFIQQLITFSTPKDLLIAISGSGNSPNIINAVNWANENNLHTIGITGFNGGELIKISKNSIHIPLNDMCTVESIHSFILHYIVIEIKKRFKS